MDKRPSGAEFTEWMASTGLSAPQVALLCHSNITIGVGSHAARQGRGQRSTHARQVWKWRQGDPRCPMATWELLRAKGLLLRLGLVTFEELVSTPFDHLLEGFLLSK